MLSRGWEMGEWNASLCQPRLPGTHRGALSACLPPSPLSTDSRLRTEREPASCHSGTQVRTRYNTPLFSPAQPCCPVATACLAATMLQPPSTHPPEPLLPSHDKPGAVRPQGNRIESRRLASPLSTWHTPAYIVRTGPRRHRCRRRQAPQVATVCRMVAYTLRLYSSTLSKSPIRRVPRSTYIRFLEPRGLDMDTSHPSPKQINRETRAQSGSPASLF